MKHLIAVLTKWKILLLALVKPLGFWAPGVIALIDASSIPLPMDLIMAGYAWADRPHFYVYAIAAGIGSSIGALLPFYLGRAGGELFLLRRIDRKRYEKLRNRFERQELLAMIVPSIMPPPTPWKLFVFGAGVFDMRVSKFLLAVVIGRTLRYLVEGLLVVLYGPQIIDFMGKLIHRHLVLLLLGSVAIIGLLVWWLVRRALKKSPLQKEEVETVEEITSAIQTSIEEPFKKL